MSAARHAGVKERQRDPEEERQVRVSFTKGGRPLRERGLKMDLVEATGVAPDDFAKVQKAIVTLRNNLIASVF
ncbi:MarR family transcriptional regulator [Caballeronia choica]|uniref:MarR family transcriptional regulator n=1 Tax=Caballeronia choica TaxID=326476 RepID=A0A158HT06_9BURK|nr:MarR family transcriptional regulator [Caballeronia choica]